MEQENKNVNTNSSKITNNQRGKYYIPKTNLPPEFEMGRVPPQALDVEEAVLGSLLLERNALNAVVDILRPEVFYREAHQYIYEAIAKLFADTEPVDLVTVMDKLRSQGRLELSGGAYYLTQLTHKVASAANIEYYSKIIIEKYVQRQLITASTETIRDAYEDTADAFDLLDSAESRLFAISENNFRKEFEPLPNLIKRSLSEIEAAKDSDGALRGVPSGFTELDRITGGWQKTDLIIIAARPSMGKTAFALSMARNMAVDFNKPVAVFSLEMDATQLAVRLMSAQSNIEMSKLRKGALTEQEWGILHQRLGALTDAPIYIDDTPALSLFELRAKCRRMREQYKIETVIIDYLQLMSGSHDQKGNREQEISGISRGLKSLAKELEAPVIVLSQLNRGVETRSGTKKPILADLRESGAIEQDADMVLFVYRPEYYNIDEDERGFTAGMGDIIISKHRNGALGEVRLKFQGSCAKFIDPEAYMTDNFQDLSYMPANNDFENNEGRSNMGVVHIGSKMNDEKYPDIDNMYTDDIIPPEDHDIDF
jgi:replicative DNA helicase